MTTKYMSSVRPSKSLHTRQVDMHAGEYEYKNECLRRQAKK